MKQSANPLLDFSDLPRYAAVKTGHVTPAIDQLLAENRELIGRLMHERTAATWEGFVAPIEDANERLSRAWGIAAHLHAVDDGPAIREAFNANLPKITSYWTELAQNAAMFEKYKALRASEGFARLSTAQRRIIENEIRDFRLGGAELPSGKKQRFGDVQTELAALASRFSENLLDATNAFGAVLESEDEVAGIPDDVLWRAREGAHREGRAGWKFTLQAPSYTPAMQYARNRELRQRLYRAYVTRASEFGKSEWDNTSIIRAELRLRREAAQLLGYSNYAELSLVPKMARTPGEVLHFLDDLAQKVLPFARRDYAELEQFARAELGLERLEVWDLAYASEKLRARRFAFSDEDVKHYFPEPKVLEGMFRVVEELYGVRIEADAAEVWHPEVRFLRIRGTDGSVVGRFYMDLYARETKREGAWMDEVIARRRLGASIQTPVACVICNFSPPFRGADGKKRPALFTHDEVITLFHEFGHALHHLLSKVDYLGVSGIRGVEWDAIELPSQFMENFCWEWEVLRHMTSHVDRGEPLPRELFEKMIAAKNFQSGMQMVRQIEFSLFDMRLHCEFDPEGKMTPLELIEEIRRKVAVVHPPEYNRFPGSFAHIFAGGYCAGYYSYKWAEVLSADAYSVFEEHRTEKMGVIDPVVGSRFRDEILAVGGSRPALESFEAFRGRGPSVAALLRHNGMVAA